MKNFLKQKQLQTCLLGAALLALPAAVQAQFLYTTSDGTITITGYTGTNDVVTIPSTINGLPVTSIGDDAFADCSSVTNVTIPASVTSIGDGAFASCTSLTNVTIPASVTSIGDAAFYSCTNLTSITIPDSVTKLGISSFNECRSLTNVTIGDGITSIGYGTFRLCALTSIAIPDSVISIENGPLDIGLITPPFGAFAGCPLTSVMIPDSVTSIGDEAFASCTSLTNVTIGNSVTNIGDAAFESCISLTSVYFKGNAPAVGFGFEFNDNNNVTVYYLPGTTGWGATFDGRPAVLWNPRIQTSDASFGLHGNQFGFNITGTADIPLLIEASTNLASPFWFPLQTITLTNSLVRFSDPQWTNYPARFYRLRSP